MRWSALMQGEAIEGGGFRGRSNKLVDGCYSWWVGGGVPVVEALAKKEREDKREKKRQKEEARIEVEGDAWEDVIRELFPLSQDFTQVNSYCSFTSALQQDCIAGVYPSGCAERARTKRWTKG